MKNTKIEKKEKHVKHFHTKIRAERMHDDFMKMLQNMKKRAEKDAKLLEPFVKKSKKYGFEEISRKLVDLQAKFEKVAKAI